MHKVVSIFIVCLIFGVLFSTEPTVKTVSKHILSEKEIFGQEAEWELVENFLPVFGYLLHGQNGDNVYEQYVTEWFPVYRYLSDQEVLAKAQENKSEIQIGAELAKGILEENAQGKECETQEEDEAPEDTNAGEAKKAEDSEAVKETENNEISKEAEKQKNPEEIVEADEEMEQEEEMETLQDTMDSSEIFLTPSGFVPAEKKQKEYDWETYTDMEKVREEFFAIDATTEIEDERINPQVLLEKDLSISEGNGGPQILIYHTHSQETFADSDPENADTSIVGAGEYLAGLLQDTYGYEVLHHTGEYDVETRDYAYSNALPNIEAVLAEYPSIEVVIDLHRDAVAEDTKLVSQQNGKTAAQVMFFNGLSHTKKQGDIEYLENPYIDDNLAFAFQMQVLCNEYYPGLTRRIYLKGYRYNMHLCSKSLLIELGAQTNTCDEAKNTLDIVAHVLDMCLSGEEDG